MNISSLLFISSTLAVIWVVAVVAASSLQQKGRTSDGLRNSQTLRILNPVFYLLLAGTVGFYLLLPVLFGGVAAVAWSLPMITIIYLITYKSEFGKVSVTEMGKALCVTTFTLLTIFILPLSYLFFYWATN